MFSKLKIQAKLLIMMGMVMLLGVVIVGWSLITIVQLDALGNQLVRLDQEGSNALEAGNAATRLALADLSSSLNFAPDSINDHSAQRALLDHYIVTTRQRTEYEEVREALGRIEELLPVLDANWEYFYPFTLVETFPEDFDYTEMDTRIRQNAAIMSATKSETDTIYGVVQDELDDVKSAADLAYFSSLGIGGAAMVLFLLLSLIAALTIARSINAPMVTLIDAARAIEKGTFDPKPVQKLTTRTDEIGRIARSMIEMAENVEARRVALEQEAAELRAKLA